MENQIIAEDLTPIKSELTRFEKNAKIILDDIKAIAAAEETLI